MFKASSYRPMRSLKLRKRMLGPWEQTFEQCLPPPTAAAELYGCAMALDDSSDSYVLILSGDTDLNPVATAHRFDSSAVKLGAGSVVDPIASLPVVSPLPFSSFAKGGSSACCVSRNGARGVVVADCGWRGRVSVWRDVCSVSQRDLVHRHSFCLATRDWLWDCAMSRRDAGETLAAVGDSSYVKIYDVERGTIITSVKTPQNMVMGCAFVGWTGNVVSADGKGVTLWDVSAKKGSGGVRFDGHARQVTKCASSANGRVIVSAGEDMNVCVWDVRKPDTALHVLTGHTGIVSGCSVSSDGSRIASASQDSTTRVWDGLTGQQLHVHSEPEGAACNRCAVSENGRFVLSSHQNGRAQLLDLGADYALPEVEEVDVAEEQQPLPVAEVSEVRAMFEDHVSGRVVATAEPVANAMRRLSNRAKTNPCTLYETVIMHKMAVDVVLAGERFDQTLLGDQEETRQFFVSNLYQHLIARLSDDEKKLGMMLLNHARDHGLITTSDVISVSSSTLALSRSTEYTDSQVERLTEVLEEVLSDMSNRLTNVENDIARVKQALVEFKSSLACMSQYLNAAKTQRRINYLVRVGICLIPFIGHALCEVVDPVTDICMELFVASSPSEMLSAATEALQLGAEFALDEYSECSEAQTAMMLVKLVTSDEFLQRLPESYHDSLLLAVEESMGMPVDSLRLVVDETISLPSSLNVVKVDAEAESKGQTPKDRLGYLPPTATRLESSKCLSAAVQGMFESATGGAGSVVNGKISSSEERLTHIGALNLLRDLFGDHSLSSLDEDDVEGALHEASMDSSDGSLLKSQFTYSVECVAALLREEDVSRWSSAFAQRADGGVITAFQAKHLAAVLLQNVLQWPPLRAPKAKDDIKAAVKSAAADGVLTFDQFRAALDRLL
jgi:WD domain, G-beta repeat